MKREVAAGREVKACPLDKAPEQVIFAEYVRFQTGRQKMNTMEVPRAGFVLAKAAGSIQANCAFLGGKCLQPASSRQTAAAGDGQSVQIPGKRHVFRFFIWPDVKHTETCSIFGLVPEIFKEAMTVAVNEKLRIRLKGYDHTLVDTAAAKIVETAKRTGARVAGPIPLPTDKEIVTILRAVHKYKDSREQFEMRTHKRLIDVLRPSAKTVEALKGLELPAGVEIELNL